MSPFPRNHDGLPRYSTMPKQAESRRAPLKPTNRQTTTNRLDDQRVAVHRDCRRPFNEVKQNRRPLNNAIPSRPHNAQLQKQIPHPTATPKRITPPRLVDLCKVPHVMYDKKRSEYYIKLGYLGEGGFARCFKVKNRKGHYFAAKVISKEALKDQKNRTTLFAEINIHRSMKHASIVEFLVCFEDNDNVYLIMELCENKTLEDMLQARGTLTEPELRYFLIQILDACRYMHDNHVIHRDIKLGNIFLDKNMDIKIGDFGLSALLVGDNARKRTVCGTPNYIAPEILFDKKKGHNHKVDLWSIGVLVYTLLVGMHPFEQRQVKAIYRKIHDNSQTPSYAFPANVPISDHAKDLISKLLVNKPEERLSVPEILRHRFFQNGSIPTHIPQSALERPPQYNELFSLSHATHTHQSPGRAADALRTASDQTKSYLDTRPVGTLNIMSEHIPDPKAQFPLHPTQPVGDSEQNEKASDQDDTELGSRKRKTEEEEHPANKRRAVSPNDKESHEQSPQSLSGKASIPLFDTTLKILQMALEYKETDMHAGKRCDNVVWNTQNVFIDKWVDVTAKYGMGYMLSDGTCGVFFNDATTMVTRDNTSFHYIAHDAPPVVYQADTIPSQLEKKITLLHHFQEHMSEKLVHLAINVPEPMPVDQLIYLLKYSVNDHAVVFRLNNGVIQMIFHDRSKLILTEYGTRIFHVNAENQLVKYLLRDAATSGDPKLERLLTLAKDMLLAYVMDRDKMQ